MQQSINKNNKTFLSFLDEEISNVIIEDKKQRKEDSEKGFLTPRKTIGVIAYFTKNGDAKKYFGYLGQIPLTNAEEEFRNQLIERKKSQQQDIDIEMVLKERFWTPERRNVAEEINYGEGAVIVISEEQTVDKKILIDQFQGSLYKHEVYFLSPTKEKIKLGVFNDEWNLDEDEDDFFVKKYVFAQGENPLKDSSAYNRFEKGCLFIPLGIERRIIVNGNYKTEVLVKKPISKTIIEKEKPTLEQVV